MSENGEKAESEASQLEDTSPRFSRNYSFLIWHFFWIYIILNLELTKINQAKLILVILLKIVGVLGSLYFFICSLDIMSQSFRLVGGKF